MAGVVVVVVVGASSDPSVKSSLSVSPVAVAPSLAVMGRKRVVRWAISGGDLTKGTEVNGGWHLV